MNNKVLKTAFRFVLFASIGMGILYWLYHNMDQAFQAQCELDGVAAEDCSLLSKLWNDFLQVKWFWIGMVLCVYLASNILRALRWQMLLKPLGKSIRFVNAFWAMMLGYFINSLIPRAGEIAKPAAVARYEKIPLEQVIGTIAVARILDVICLLVMIGLALIFQFDNLWGWLSENAFQKAGGGISPLIILGILGLLVLILAWVFREKLQSLSIYQKVENIVRGFIKGLLSVKDVENPGLFVAQTIGIWVMYYFTTYLAFFAFEPTSHLAPSAGLLVFVFGAFGIVIPSPGGLGTYHFLITTALTTFFAVSQPDAFSFSMIAFFTVYLCNILFGLIGLVVLPLANKENLN